MDTLDNFRQIICDIIIDHAKIPYSYGEIEQQTIFDKEGDHYLLMLVGREGVRRVHGCLIHLDIINGKIWIQRDGTEDGVAEKLLEAGVPKNKIVLGFRSLELRKHTEFAVV